MAAETDFERLLRTLLAGESVDAILLGGSDENPAVEALRVLSAIAQVSREALFGTAAPTPEAHRWGHLEIREEIGRGTSGTVYRAWDTRLAREVALKLFDPDSASTDAAIAEGRLLARLRHPNIVTVYGADTFDGVSGLWMELVRGETLSDLVQRDGASSIEDSLLIGIELAGALAAVHAAGILHRDVKARNVVRQRGGRLVLTDFGAGHDPDQAPVTGDGVGTPLYMAPEVLAGGSASVQNDVYGLGVLLYHLVTGSYPVKAVDVASLQAAHRTSRRREWSAEVAEVPAVACAVIDRGCAPDPAARYSTAHEFQLALSEALRVVLDIRAHVVPAAVRRWRRWRRPVLAAGGAVVSLALLTWFGWNTEPGRASRRGAGLVVPPRSTLYFSLGGGMAALDGRTIRVFSAGHQGAHALAVSRQYGIRLMASAPPWMGDAWWALDGTPQRAAPTVDGLCCFSDGTTDGRFNYAVRQDSTLLEPIGSRPLAPPAVYRFNSEWRQGELLFQLTSPAPGDTSTVYSGIAFDGESGSLWVTLRQADGTTHVEHWGLDGRRLGAIPVPPGAGSIAIDPADGTLWLLRDNLADAVMHFDNVTRAGAALGTLDVARPLAVGAGGLEFAWPSTR